MGIPAVARSFIVVIDMSPPHLPIINGHDNLSFLPDLFLTALSVCFLFSSSTRPFLSRTNFISFSLCPRRFLKIPTMSRRGSPQRHFANPQSLSEWLKPRLPSDSFASWGVRPGTKNVHNLWLELSEGETSLADSAPPVRTVHVVVVRVIGKDDQFLIESHQELSDGSVRKRGRPLSEKMKPVEDVESAVIRAVSEELGSLLNVSVNNSVHSDIVKIVPGSYRKKVEERNSLSYPGLPACYILHSVDAWVEGLPDGDFCTEEDKEYRNSETLGVANEAVSVKRHFWKWVSSESIE
ncbi:hypothetical protein FNV43_RR23838 [Rhamnella rubrinervis]|uniref:Nudix hydrolase domain-containing protein n=1 Tax=Rhamnella rubrinervis TaxID=2594499 RepID=A0A8K0DQ16_9ROSA|nr:hypothetical protein FNV43_RR23838 [Rhamnella rubrinervis]